MIKKLTVLPAFVFSVIIFYLLSTSNALAVTASFQEDPTPNPAQTGDLIQYVLTKDTFGDTLIAVLYVDGRAVDNLSCSSGTKICRTNGTRGGSLLVPDQVFSPYITIRVCQGAGNHNGATCDGKTTLVQATIEVSDAGGGGGEPGKNPCSLTECQTAIGNIPTNPQAFATKILQIATGVGGGIALILMVIGSIRVLTSAGDQQKLAGGRDMIIAAVSGLLFIIFSVVILRFIGINIFGGVI